MQKVQRYSIYSLLSHMYCLPHPFHFNLWIAHSPPLSHLPWILQVKLPDFIIKEGFKAIILTEGPFSLFLYVKVVDLGNWSECMLTPGWLLWINFFLKKLKPWSFFSGGVQIRNSVTLGYWLVEFWLTNGYFDL